MFLILFNASYWNIVSAITNIVLSVLTLVALFITLYTVRINSFPKGNMELKKEDHPTNSNYRIKLVNERNVPITVNYRGFYFLDKHGKKMSITYDEKKTKLEWSDADYFNVFEDQINGVLLREGFSYDQNVNIYAFFKTSTNKLYKKSISHKIKKSLEEQIKSTMTLKANAN